MIFDDLEAGGGRSTALQRTLCRAGPPAHLYILIRMMMILMMIVAYG